MKTQSTSFSSLSWKGRLTALAGAALCSNLLCFSATPAGADTQVLRGNIPAVVAHLRPLERLAPGRRLNLAIGLPLRNRAALMTLLQELRDPASPKYHRWLTAEQFAEKYGPAEEDYQALIAFATAKGLTVTGTHPNRTILDVEGSVADIGKALRTSLRVYQHPREARTFYAPVSEPSLDLAVPVLGISGLSDYGRPCPRLKATPLNQAPKARPRTGSGPDGTYLGSDFRHAYIPGTALTGSGQAVGLLQFDGYTANDIAYYENLAGLPSVTLSNVLLNGFDGTPTGSGGEVEVSLDIEMAISMAPGLAAVFVYEAGPNGNWYDILNRMATDNLARQLSCSWYIPGGPADPVADQIFQQMAAQGQSFFDASGDYGAYTGPIDFPGDTPYITQVGGTTLTTSGPGGSFVSETVWNWGNGIASGGGISTSYPIPSWQARVNMTANGGSPTMRNTPDVALTADSVYVRADDQDYNVGGTSCAAPLWAGFAAVINQQAAANGRPPLGFLNPALYALGLEASYTLGLRDITTGSNSTPYSPATTFQANRRLRLVHRLGHPERHQSNQCLGPARRHSANQSRPGICGQWPAGWAFRSAGPGLFLEEHWSGPSKLDAGQSCDLAQCEPHQWPTQAWRPSNYSHGKAELGGNQPASRDLYDEGVVHQSEQRRQPEPRV